MSVPFGLPLSHEHVRGARNLHALHARVRPERVRVVELEDEGRHHDEAVASERVGPPAVGEIVTIPVPVRTVYN